MMAANLSLGGPTMMKPRITLTLVCLLAMGVAWVGYDGLPQADQTHINDRRDGKENDYYKPSMIDPRHLNDPPYDDPRTATMLEDRVGQPLSRFVPCAYFHRRFRPHATQTVSPCQFRVGH
jgi:hypothetical protein